MRRFFGARDFVLTNSGSSANLVAITALCSLQLDGRLSEGDEVITPAVTFPTTLAPIVQNRLTPVFVDCDVGTYDVDVDEVAAAISPRTRALVVPHTLGNPCRMDRLMEIVHEHDLWLVEDCCDALGARFDGQLVGTFGDVATCSFYPAHHITLGEGGGIVVQSPKVAKIVRSVRDWGRDCWCDPGKSDTCGKRFGWQLGDLPSGYDHKYTYSENRVQPEADRSTGRDWRCPGRSNRGISCSQTAQFPASVRRTEVTRRVPRPACRMSRRRAGVVCLSFDRPRRHHTGGSREVAGGLPDRDASDLRGEHPKAARVPKHASPRPRGSGAFRHRDERHVLHRGLPRNYRSDD